MATEGIEAVFLTTHNWGKSAKFFQALGFALEFETDHHSGKLSSGSGPYLFIAEVPQDRPTGVQLVLKAAAEDSVTTLVHSRRTAQLAALRRTSRFHGL